MPKFHPALLAFALMSGILMGQTASTPLPLVQTHPARLEMVVPQNAGAAYENQSVFRFPVVPDSVISGYFDHQPSSGLVTFYGGRRSTSGAGFYFSCSNPAMYDWVGCEIPFQAKARATTTANCGTTVIKASITNILPTGTQARYAIPVVSAKSARQVYAPAAGRVLMAGTDPNRPANGWHIQLQHNLNGNGKHDDDNFRSVYLHFTANALAVVAGQTISEGQYLGLGGSTGYSSSPHLHFEVQRSSDYFQTNYWSVDPYGWKGEGSNHGLIKM